MPRLPAKYLNWIYWTRAHHICVRRHLRQLLMPDRPEPRAIPVQIDVHNSAALNGMFFRTDDRVKQKACCMMVETLDPCPCPHPPHPRSAKNTTI